MEKSLNVSFKASLNLFSSTSCIPASGVLCSAYITMHDSCTWSKVPVANDGTIDVDFLLRVRKPDEDTHLQQLEEFTLNSRLKIHFFSMSNDNEIFVAAGHWPLEDVLRAAAVINDPANNPIKNRMNRVVNNAAHTQTEFQCTHNFEGHGVHIQLVPGGKGSTKTRENLQKYQYLKNI